MKYSQRERFELAREVAKVYVRPDYFALIDRDKDSSICALNKLVDDCCFNEVKCAVIYHALKYADNQTGFQVSMKYYDKTRNPNNNNGHNNNGHNGNGKLHC
jgi:hypothetical protein